MSNNSIEKLLIIGQNSIFEYPDPRCGPVNKQYLLRLLLRLKVDLLKQLCLENKIR